jgi:hypothetical protein
MEVRIFRIKGERMSRAIKALATSLAVAASLLIAPLTTSSPAHATTTPAIAVREDAGTLNGTLVSGLENATHLKVTLTVNSGVINFDPTQAPLVSVAPGSSTGTTTLVLLGTQANLNGAFDKVHLTSCGQALTMSASVMDTDQLSLFASNGHAYKWVNAGHYLNWHDAKAAAEAMTFDSVSGSQNGYLVTITTQAESDFVTQMVLGQNLAAWMGASDSYTEIYNADNATAFTGQNGGSGTQGHWHWVTGPEGGTRFYDQGTGTRSGSFSNWASGEPNNSQGREHVGMLRSDSTWNDKYEYTSNQIDSFVVEFGGMPGNALSSSISSSATYTRPFVDPCATTRPIVTVTADAGGQAAITDYSDPNGDHKVITPVPDPGFAVSDVTLDGSVTPLTDGAVTLTNVLVDHNVHISFSRTASSRASLNLYAGPTVLTSYPKTSLVEGGTRLTIEGTNWSSLNDVEVDGKPAQIVSKSSNQVQIVIPAHAEGRATAVFHWNGGTLIFMDVLEYKAAPRKVPVVKKPVVNKPTKKKAPVKKTSKH